MIHTKIYLISLGYPRPSIYLQCSILAKNTVRFICFFVVSAMLSQLKISCLDNQRREAKQKYQDHLQNYVTSHLGRPMEKLSVSTSLWRMGLSSKNPGASPEI